MNRRSAASLVALGLLVAGIIFASVMPTGYVTLKPGPTFDVLGSLDGKEVIAIKGHRVYKDGGQLRMITVLQSRPETKLTLVDVMDGWIDPKIAVIPRSAAFPKPTSNKQQQQQSALQMSTSQDDAVAAALSAAKIDYRYAALVSSAVKDGPADGKLEGGDVILAIDDTPVSTADQVVKLVQARKPGDRVVFRIRRGTAERTVPITTVADEKDPKKARIGVSVGTDYAFPFDVSIQLPGDVGGPSAGMMFALTIYDLLTPGSLTGGRNVAGTGEISPDGIVGPIGGVQQKLAAAMRDGARLFLVSDENCPEAAAADFDHSKITMLKIHTLQDAITQVTAWREGKTSEYDRCTR